MALLVALMALDVSDVSADEMLRAAGGDALQQWASDAADGRVPALAFDQGAAWLERLAVSVGRTCGAVATAQTR